MNEIAAVILAAGAASRMGRPKQLLDWGGQPLVVAVARQALAAPFAGVYVVVGQAADQVAQALAGLPVQVVENPAFASGQASSLRAGIAALPEHIRAALVLLGDQPFVSSEIMETLAAVWQAGRGPIVAPLYGAQRGNPVLFDRSVFAELLALEGDQGARALLRADPARVHAVPFADTRPLDDIDTPDDYAQALERAGLAPKTQTN